MIKQRNNTIAIVDNSGRECIINVIIIQQLLKISMAELSHIIILIIILNL